MRPRHWTLGNPRGKRNLLSSSLLSSTYRYAGRIVHEASKRPSHFARARVIFTKVLKSAFVGPAMGMVSRSPCLLVRRQHGNQDGRLGIPRLRMPIAWVCPVEPSALLRMQVQTRSMDVPPMTVTSTPQLEGPRMPWNPSARLGLSPAIGRHPKSHPRAL